MNLSARASYRGNGEIIKREEFEARKEAAEAAIRARLDKKPKKLSSAGRNLDGYPLLQVTTHCPPPSPAPRTVSIPSSADRGSRAPLLGGCQSHRRALLSWGGTQALAQREEAVRNGKLTTIVFIRDRNKKGQEVSGYIDYGQRYGRCTPSTGKPTVVPQMVNIHTFGRQVEEWRDGLCLRPEEALDAQANGLEFLQLGNPNLHIKCHNQLPGASLRCITSYHTDRATPDRQQLVH